MFIIIAIKKSVKGLEKHDLVLCEESCRNAQCILQQKARRSGLRVVLVFSGRTRRVGR